MPEISQPHVGVLLPTRELAMTGDYTFSRILDFARAAEDCGFDSVWTGDSMFARPRLDPLIVLAATATVTTRLTLGTAAYTAALRHPLTAVTMISSLDQLTGGRLELALGSGFPIPESAHEFASLGVPFGSRARLLDETVRLWRQVWRSAYQPDSAEFTGSFWHADRLDRLVPATKPGGPRLWLAGSDTARVCRRVAQDYDGWLPFLPDPAAYATAWQRIRREAQARGRPDGAIAPGVYLTVNVNDDRAAARRELEDYVRRYYARSLAEMSRIQGFACGGAQDITEWVTSYLRAGARTVVIRIGSLRPERQLPLLAARVLPELRQCGAD